MVYIFGSFPLSILIQFLSSGLEMKQFYDKNLLI